jgi:hypothetical protein
LASLNESDAPDLTGVLDAAVNEIFNRQLDLAAAQRLETQYRIAIRADADIVQGTL